MPVAIGLGLGAQLNQHLTCCSAPLMGVGWLVYIQKPILQIEQMNW